MAGMPRSVAGINPDTTRRDAVRAAGERARAEAEARRMATEAAATGPEERGGRNGLDPTRYGDWERRGLAVDF